TIDSDTPAPEPIREPFPRPVDELLVGDRRVAVLADVARLAREHDRRLALERDEDVRVAVDDGEAADVRDRSLEARVLGAADDGRVQPVARQCRPDVRMPPAHFVHDASTPFTSAQIAWLRGVGTPCSRPKRTIPPLR